jgi:hypothetical protein
MEDVVMNAMPRRSFLGLAGAGAVALGSRPVLGIPATAPESGYYGNRLAVIGLGQGEGASVSVAWLPLTGGRDQTPRPAHLVILGLDGKVQVEKSVQLAPFTGASIQFKPTTRLRRSVIGYVFIDLSDDV